MRVYRKVKVATIAAALVLLIIPLISRAFSGNPLLAGPLSYAGLHMFPFEFLRLSPEWIAAIGIISAIASLYLISKIFDALLLHQKINVISLMMIAISPAFIYQGLGFGAHVIAVPLLLGMVLATLRKKHFVAGIIAFIIPWTGILPSAMSLLIMLTIKLRGDRIAHLLVPTVASAIGFTAAAGSIPVVVVQFPLATEMGALVGFSFFSVIIAGIGFYKMWEHKYKLYPLFLLTGIVFAISVFLEEGRIYANILLAVFAAYGLLRMTNRKWSSQTIKAACVGLVFVGLFVAYTGYTIDYVSVKPTKKDLDVISRMNETGSILSDPYYGPWLAHYTGNAAVFEHPLAAHEQNLSSTIFQSRSLATTRPLLKRYNASYLYIDNAMRQGGIWQTEQEGLLFLLRNNETFKSIYRDESYEIWRIQ